MFKITRKQDIIQKSITGFVILLASILLLSLIMSRMNFNLPENYKYFQYFITVILIVLVHYVDPINELMAIKYRGKNQLKRKTFILLCILFVLFIIIAILSYNLLFLRKNYIYFIVLCFIIYSLLLYYINKYMNRIRKR